MASELGVVSDGAASGVEGLLEHASSFGTTMDSDIDARWRKSFLQSLSAILAWRLALPVLLVRLPSGIVAPLREWWVQRLHKRSRISVHKEHSVVVLSLFRDICHSTKACRAPPSASLAATALSASLERAVPRTAIRQPLGLQLLSNLAAC